MLVFTERIANLRKSSGHAFDTGPGGPSKKVIDSLQIYSYIFSMDPVHFPGREIEIKLDLGSFTNYLKLIGFLGKIEHEESQLNAFFDTEERHLAKAGWALRVRVESNRGLVTIKSISTEKGAAFIRQEVESQISRAEALEILNLRADVMSLAILPIEHIVSQVGEIALSKLVQFENTRQKKLFKIGDYNYILEIDKTEFNDGSVDYELELELSDASRIDVVEDKLRKMFTSLNIPFEPQSESKFARALARASIF